MAGPVGLLRRHAFVIAGVALPVVVLVALALARGLPRLLVEDPRYDLLYSIVGTYSEAPHTTSCEIAAVDGRLRVRWRRTEQPAYSHPPRVYRLDPVTGEARELTVPEPDDLATFDGTLDLFLGGLEDVRIDTSPRAPDGYEFETSYSGGSGLFGELFSHGSRGPRSKVEKDGRVIAVQPTNQAPYGYETVTFLGWAIPIEDGR